MALPRFGRRDVMNEHIRFAYALSGAGAGTALEDDDTIAAALQAADLAWLHMQADDPASAAWIERHLAYLDRPIRDALLADETRPRAVAIDSGLMLILRGINTNPGADPEDMVSLRLWVDPARIVSLSRRPVASIADLAAEIAAGSRPDRAGAFLCRLLERIDSRIEREIAVLGTETDSLEENVVKKPGPHIRERIGEARAQVVDLRRYIAPQRDALSALAGMRFDWLTKSDRRSLHEAQDRLVRQVEELDATRDRLVVVRDELQNAQGERLNRNIYVLSVLSAVFLPLTFLTGMMGINLAGMPGAEWPGAFWTFAGLLVLVVVVQVLVLRWLRLF